MLTAPPLTSEHHRIAWRFRIFPALAFLAAGLAKLTSTPQMVRVFDAIGVGQWFRYLTGAIEIVGVVLLPVPTTGFFGGLLLLVTMLGAIVAHLFVIGGRFLPALVLGALSASTSRQLRPIRD